MIWECIKEYITKTSEIREDFLEEGYLLVCEQSRQALGEEGHKSFLME